MDNLSKKSKRIWKCICITGLITLAYFGLSSVAFWIFGKPLTPFRGNISFYTDFYIHIFSLLSMLFLAWFVIYTIINYQKHFSEVIKPPAPSHSSKMFNINCSINETMNMKCGKVGKVCQNEQAKCLSKYDNYIYERVSLKWLSIQIIAKRTEVIGKMITYPFFVFALLLVARHSFFDHWSWPLPLIIVISLIIFIMLYFALILFYKANGARKSTVAHLHNEQLKLMNIQMPTIFDAANDRRTKFIEQKSKYIDYIVKDIQNLKSGAFTPLGRNPIFIAILAPLGSMGSISILQYLPQLLNK